MQSQISSARKNTFMALMIVTGAINTIAYKFQNKQYVNQGSYFKYFFHPYMQSASMFFGQFLALFVFYFFKQRDPEAHKMRMLTAKSKGKQIEMNILLLAIPSILDCITSMLHYFALNFIVGSVYQMLRGGSIITTFFFSITFLKAKIKKQKIIGSITVLIGIVIIGFSNLYFSESTSNSEDTSMIIVGYVLIIISLFTQGFLFVFEEKLFEKYHLEPLQVVGFEGLFGLCIQLILIPSIMFIPCGFGSSACVFNFAGMPFLERPQSYFREVFSDAFLLIFVILGFLSIFTFNVTGVSVTKYINALARSIGDVTRTVLIWIFGIIITVTLGSTYPNYKWQLIDSGAILVELLGFAILIVGNLIYNGMIKWPDRRKTDSLMESTDQID